MIDASARKSTRSGNRLPAHRFTPAFAHDPLFWFWLIILGAALVGGYVLGKGIVILDALLFAGIAGIITVSVPIEWLYVTLFATACVIAPSLQYFLGITQLGYIPPALAIAVAAKLFLLAALRPPRGPHAERADPQGKSAIALFVYAYFAAFAISLAFNRPSVFQVILAVKLLLPVWSVFFAILLGFLSSEFLLKAWRWMIPLALIQLPLVIYQHFVIAPTRPDAGTVNAADCVVGTFGGDPMAGGNSAALMLFLIAAIAVAIVLNRCGKISRIYMLLTLATAFISLLLTETKAAFVFLPLAILIPDLREILARPARVLGIILIGGPLLFGMFKAYQILYWEQPNQSTGQDSSSHIEHHLGYFFDPNEYYLDTGEVGRGAALAIWWGDPQADLATRLIGYGPAASRPPSSFLSDGVISKRYRPLKVAATTAAELLWDIGIVGFTMYLAILISAIATGLRHLPFRDSNEEHHVLGVATAMCVILFVVVFYNFHLIENTSVQLLFVLSVGTVSVLSKRLKALTEKNQQRRAERATATRRFKSLGVGRSLRWFAPPRKPRATGLTSSAHATLPAQRDAGPPGEIRANVAAQPVKQGMLKHAVWAAIGTWGARGTTFIVFAILTRLLPPGAIGLLAFIGVLHVQVLIFASCFAEWLIWNHESTPEQESSIFWFQVLFSSLAALTLGIAGYFWGSTWIDHPQASTIIAVFASSIPFSAAAAIPEVLLRRRFAFKQFALRSLVATLLGGIGGVSLAFAGYGVWSLVWKQLIEAAVYVIVAFSVARWRPRFVFQLRYLGGPVRYGFGAATTWTIGSLSARVDSMLIGPILGATKLGYYNVGQRPAGMLWELFTGVIVKVAYPHLAAVANDRKAMTKLHAKLIRSTSLIGAPAYAALGALSPVLLPLVFGSQWETSIPVLQVLCLSGLTTGVTIYSQDVLMASGRVRAALKVNVACLVVTSLFVYIGAQYGIVYAAIGGALETLITLPIGLRLARRASDLTFRQALRAVAPGLSAAAAIYATIGATSHYVHAGSPVLQLLAEACAGGISLLLAWWIFAPDLFIELRQTLQKPRLKHQPG